ncbi:hypothetical protein FB451DRAFT_1189846 [Mycena latifolia]|nr:hypothetical protein FB451DRAFT_1189846 [Mycena latifolia]
MRRQMWMCGTNRWRDNLRAFASHDRLKRQVLAVPPANLDPRATRWSSYHGGASKAKEKTSSSITTGPILEVPSELWALVAKSSRRQSLARLCAVSHGFHTVFSPLLYSTATTNPPLKYKQTALLIETLAATHSPHPGLFVRRLVFPSYGLDRRIDGQTCLAALSRLFDAPGDKRPVRGSALRSLEWGARGELQGSMDALGPLLCTPGCFPNLKEIVIKCPPSCTHFDFLRIPRLEKIELDLTAGKYEEWLPSWEAFSCELATLPSSSPLLHTLKLQLTMYAPRKSIVPPPWDAYSGLLAAINQLRLPVLEVLELSIEAGYFDLPAPETDFLPLLRQHPALKDLTLYMRKVRIPAASEIALSLPRVRAFTGSLDHCAVVATRARELACLSVSFPQFFNEDALSRLFLPGAAPTVTQLTVRGVDTNGDFVLFPYALSPRSLSCLVLAFPNLTYLDIDISHKMKDYSANLVSLPLLEYLCLRAHKEVPERAWYRPVAEIFPVAKYATHISMELLPALTQLVDVRVVLGGDRSIEQRGCTSCDDERREPGPLWVDYRFWVRRTEGKAELVFVEDET